MIKNNPKYEQYLVSRITKGDSEAYSEIFKEYYTDLTIFACSFTGEITDAKEIVQKTFVKLWEDHKTLDVKVSLRSILLKSVQNRCLDCLRHKKIIIKHNTYVANNNHVFEYDTDSYLLYSELKIAVDSAMSRMPDIFRVTFEMHRNEGLKYQEIADKLAVSLRTVEFRISKALDFLRNELKDFL
jgi:RNA polymerase sigma-70 factor (family 1)